jgi:hypothetical protein
VHAGAAMRTLSGGLVLCLVFVLGGCAPAHGGEGCAGGILNDPQCEAGYRCGLVETKCQMEGCHSYCAKPCTTDAECGSSCVCATPRQTLKNDGGFEGIHVAHGNVCVRHFGTLDLSELDCTSN